MSALTSLLVRDQRVAVRKIEEAIQRQVIAGGSLDTVLLELNVVAENVLAAYCGVIHGLEAASRAEILGVESEVIRLVPAPVAERHRLVPLSFANRTLKVAVSTPLEPETEQQLAFLLGVELEQRAVPEASLENALHIHYGVQLSPRVRRLGKKLADRDPGEIPYVAPLEQNTAERTGDGAYGNIGTEAEGEDQGADEGPKKRRTSRFGVVSEAKVIERESAVSVTAGGPPRRTTQELTSRAPSAPPPSPDAAPVVTQAPPAEKTAARGRISRAKGELLRRHRGPLTAARAVELLAKADHRDDILEVGFAFTRQFFDFCALFVVQEEEAELLDAAPMDDETLKVARAVVAPLGEPSTFALVHEGLVSAVGKLQRSKVDEQVRDALGRTDAQPSVLAPVMIRQRVVLVLYGDRNGEDFGLEDVPELVAFTPKLGEAFQQLILRRKFRGYAQGDARTSEAPDAPESTEPAPGDGRAPQLPGEPPKPEAAWQDQKTRSPMKKLEASEEVEARMSRDLASAPAAADSALEPESAAELEPAAEPEDERASEPPVEEVRVGTRPLASEPAPSDAPTPAPAKRAFRPSDVTTAPVSEGPTPLERAVASSLPKPRKRRKRPRTFDALGVPRSAPPPPMDDDDDESAPAVIEAATDDTEPVPLSRQKSAPKPELEPQDDDDDGGDDEFELVVEDADDETAAEVEAAAREEDEDIDSSTPLPETGPPPEPSTYKAGGQTDVIGGSQRPSRRPRAGGTKDARSEGGRRAIQADVVPASRRPQPSEPPPERPTKREVPRHADTMESDTPSIIVEMDESIEGAVRGLGQVGPDSAEAEIAQIVALGEQALPVLTRDFPGLLWFDRSRPHRRLPRGRDVSAVARAIAAFGDRAVPYLIPVLDHDGADERFYATLLASEFRHPMLVEPLGRRVFDRDERTAALAVDVLRMQRRFSGPLQDVIEGLRAEARVPRSDVHKRVAATRALGALRDVGSLELFVQLLESDKPKLVQESLRSLVALTKQDFGENIAKWESWVEQNGHRHRIEWLIDALLHADEKLRAEAGEELKRLTQEYYGYHPALPKRDREVAQRKYRDWWSAEGQKRFTVPPSAPSPK